MRSFVTHVDRFRASGLSVEDVNVSIGRVDGDVEMRVAIGHLKEERRGKKGSCKTCRKVLKT